MSGYKIEREQSEKITLDPVYNAFENLCKALGECATAIAKVCKAFVANISDIIKLNACLIRCNNKRVLHLALYSKKKRVRKKNIKRAMQIVEKYKEQSK